MSGLSKREFLVAVAAGLAGNATYAILQGLTTTGWEALISFFRGERPEFERRLPEHLAAAKTLFGDRANRMKLVGGQSHPLFPSSMHPDDRWACDTIIEYAEQLAQELRFDPMALNDSADGSFVCTGNPVSNKWSRAFMEYRYLDAKRPQLGLERAENLKLKLPFEFELRPEVLKRSVKQAYLKAPGHRGIPNWSIRTKSGLLTEEIDLLLISRLPNWIEREPRSRREFANTVTIFGGTHGVGTSAIRLVFSDLELLKRIILKTSKYEYWQVLLTIRGKKLAPHPYGGTGRFVATSVGVDFECEPVNV